MLKYSSFKNQIATLKRNDTIIIKQENQVQEINKNNNCYLLLLPVELLTRIFIISQNPSLVIVCKTFWELGSSTIVKSHYLLHRYGKDLVLGKESMKRNIVSLEVIEHLLRLHECNPNVGEEDWLFINACELNQINLCRWIIESTAMNLLREEEKIKRLYHLLNIACMKGSIETIEILINNYQLNIHHQEEIGLKLASKENQLNTVKYLYNKYNCNIHINDEKLLRDACFNGYIDLVLFFISNGSNVQAYNNTCLQNATYKRYSELVKILLNAGANPETNQNACIKHAIINDDLDSLNYLISIGGINPRFDNDWSLKQACRRGYNDIVNYLINILTNQNVENVVNLHHGMPLEECLKYGKMKTVELLLNQGADPNSKGAIRGIKYLLDIKCRIKNKDKMISLMIEAGLNSEHLISIDKNSLKT